MFNLFVFRLLRKCGNSGDSVLDERHYFIYNYSDASFAGDDAQNAACTAEADNT